jgi:hypothetical protein
LQNKFPILDRIAQMLEVSGKRVNRLSDQLIFETEHLKIIITHMEKSIVCRDGSEISGTLSVRSEIPGLSKHIDEEQIAACNRLATLGALIRDEGANNYSIVSRVTLYRGDHNALNLYVPLVVSAADLQAESLLFGIDPKILGVQVAKPVTHSFGGLKNMWGKDDFDLAAEIFEGKDLCSNGSETGLAVEFPLEEGAVSAILGHKTSLLTFETTKPHPALGEGLLFNLKQMDIYERKDAAVLANLLNRKELSILDMVPFFGAWCTDTGGSSLVFTGFWPNHLYQPGVVVNIGIWMYQRNEWLKRAFELLL